MNEEQLNLVLGTTFEPVKNAYKFSTRMQRDEIQRIVRIFEITEKQKIKNKLFAIKNLATMKVVFSNN